MPVRIYVESSEAFDMRRLEILEIQVEKSWLAGAGCLG